MCASNRTVPSDTEVEEALSNQQAMLTLIAKVGIDAAILSIGAYLGYNGATPFSYINGLIGTKIQEGKPQEVLLGVPFPGMFLGQQIAQWLNDLTHSNRTTEEHEDRYAWVCSEIARLEELYAQELEWQAYYNAHKMTEDPPYDSSSMRSIQAQL